MPIWFVNPSRSKRKGKLRGTAKAAFLKRMAKGRRKAARKNPAAAPTKARTRVIKRKRKLSGKAKAAFLRRMARGRRKAAGLVFRKKRRKSSAGRSLKKRTHSAGGSTMAKRKRRKARRASPRKRKLRRNPSTPRRRRKRRHARRANPTRIRRVRRRRYRRNPSTVETSMMMSDLAGGGRKRRKRKGSKKRRAGGRSGKRRTGIKAARRARRTIKYLRAKRPKSRGAAYIRRWKMRTNPGGLVGVVLGAVKTAAPILVGVYGSRFAANLLTKVPMLPNLLAKLGKAEGPVRQALAVIGMHFATAKIAPLRKYRTGLMLGAGFAALDSVIKASPLAGYLGTADYVETSGYLPSSAYEESADYTEDTGAYEDSADYVETGDEEDGLGAYGDPSSQFGLHSRALPARAVAPVASVVAAKAMTAPQAVPNFHADQDNAFYTGIFRGGFGGR